VSDYQKACTRARSFTDIEQIKEEIVRLAMRDALDDQVALISAELDLMCCRLRDLQEKAASGGQKHTEETGWVIESLDSPPGLPIYFTGYSTRALRWSNPGDHVNACRFARKVDAERISAWISYWGPKPSVRVCEHSWVLPARATLSKEKGVSE